MSKEKQIDLTAEEIAALKSRLNEAIGLSESDKYLLSETLTFNLWVQQQLSKAKLTIKMLKEFFCFKSEKKK